MKAIVYLIIDADKACWADTDEKRVVTAFNEGDGVLPMKLIKINVICATPAAQEINVNVPDGDGEVTVESVESTDG